MTAARKLAAILAADVVGFSRLAGADEDRTLARLRAVRSDLIDPTVVVHNGRVVKRTGDGLIVEFRSVVDAVRCAIEIQTGMAERNAGVAADKRIEFRIGVHLGDVVEEADGDLMGDGVNIAARLEGSAAPGGLILSSAAYEQVRDKVKVPFSDLGEKALKNIAPVRVYALRSDAPAATAAPWPPSERLGPPRLSIVVLPFANIGGGPEQDYFVDGVTESLTTDLSRIHGAFVIGRNTAFSYKGKAIELKQIGRELNVRYVLEGSVQRSGARMRVNVQLIDAEARNHLWADRFDKPVADLFDMQDEIVARLANTLNAQLVAAEARRAERAPNPDSMDLYFQGMACANRGWTPEHIAEARGFYERALALDLGNIDAMVGAAYLDLIAAGVFFAKDRAVRLTRAEAALTKALSSAPEHAAAHMEMGLLHNLSNRAARGVPEFERALSLDRNLASAHAYIGFAKYLDGRAEETEAHVLQALRLSPRDTEAHAWRAIAGLARFQLGSNEEAADWMRRSIDTNRNFAISHFYLAAALAHLGRLDEARSAARACLALYPDFTISRFRAGPLSDNPLYLAARERAYEGMRLAGFPEE
jgi:TolB-like protein/class 3 adenylate cyclase/Flp pilus assembly protein TadD